jgi:hypothetical protein
MVTDHASPGAQSPGRSFLSSRTAEWLLATALGLVLVKSATLSGLANVVSILPWGQGYATLLTFIAPGLDSAAPWISGAVLVVCAFSICAAANPRTGAGWWTVDIFAVVLGIFVLGPWIAALLAVLGSMAGLAAARARGAYWPILILDKFMVWAVLGVLSYFAVFMVINADRWIN